MDSFSKAFNQAIRGETKSTKKKEELTDFSKAFNSALRQPPSSNAGATAALDNVRNAAALTDYVGSYGAKRAAENARRYSDPLTQAAREDAAKAIAVRDYIRYSDPLTMMAREEAEKATRKNDPLMQAALDMQSDLRTPGTHKVAKGTSGGEGRGGYTAQDITANNSAVLVDELKKLRNERAEGSAAYALGDPNEIMAQWEKQNRIDARIGEIEKQLTALGVDPKESDVKPIDALHSTFWKGISDIGYGGASTLDFVNRLGHYALGWTPEEYDAQNTLTSQLKAGQRANVDYWNKRKNEDVQNDPVAVAVTDLGAGVVQAIPSAINAMLTGGASLAADSASLASAASAAGITSKIGQLGNTLYTLVDNAVRNPQFYSSFWQVLGNGYESAKKNGASDANAIAYALANGGINALIEIGGGIEENGVSLDWNSIKDTAFEEGVEEGVQGAFERGLEMMYGKINKPFSITDSEAVINPVTAAQEFAGGAVAGGVLGAGQVALNTFINAGRGDTQQESVRDIPTTEQIQRIAESAAQPAAPAPISIPGQEVQDINRDLVRSIEKDPEQLARLGISTKGKDGSQVRAEIRAALENQNDQQKAQNAAAVKQYADSEFADGRISETGASIISSYYSGTQNPSAYIRGMTAAYNAGLNGTDINSVDTSMLSSTQRDAALLAGQAARTQAQKAAPNIEAVRQFTEAEVEAGRMSEDGAKMILDYYDGTQNANEYISAVTAAYNAGLEGKGAQSVTSPVLTRSQRDAAYMAGQAAARQGQTELAQATVQQQTEAQPAAQAPAQQAQPTVRTTPQQKPAEAQKMPAQRAKNPGLVRDENAAKAKLSYTQKRALDIIGKVLGVKVRFVDSIDTTNKDGTVQKSGAQGYYDNGEIVLALDGDDPFLTTAVHESVHRIKELSDADYTYLRDFVTRNMSDPKYGLAEKVKGLEGYSAEEIPEEIVADGFGRILGNEAAMKQFVAENSTAAQRIMDVFADILDRIKQALTGKDSRSLTENQRKVYSDLADKLDVMMKYYQDAVTNVRESEGTANAGKRYSMSANASTDIHKAVTDKNASGDIQLTDNTPSIMTGQKGVRDLPMYMKASHIRENILTADEARAMGITVDERHDHYHGLTESKFREVIEHLDEVDIAYRGTRYANNPSRRENYFLLFPRTTDSAGNQIIVPVYINEVGQHNRVFIDTNKIATVFSPDDVKAFVSREVGKKNLVRVKNRGPISSEAPAHTTGDYTDVTSSEQAADQTAMASYADTITQPAQKSKPKNSMSDREALAQIRQRDADYAAAVERGDTETAQRMVDEAAKAAGYSVKAWHQTARDFTVFNTNNPSAALNDSETPNGIFFKTNDHDIGLEGKKQMAMVISPGKTLDFKNREEANAWYRKNIDGYDALSKEMESALKPIDDQMQDIESKMFSEGTTDEEYDRLDKEWNALLEKMHVEEDKYRGRLRELLNAYFLNDNSPYNSIHLGYDGHRYVDGRRENVETYIVFSNKQAKSADPVRYDDSGNVIPLSERFNPENEDIRYSKSDREILDAYIEEHGAIKTGEKPAREVTIPKRTTPKTKVSMTVRTVAEAGATPESFVPTIENLVANHEFDYTPYSDEAAIGNATTIAEKKGWTAALADWVKDIEKGVVNKTNTALGWALYNNAVNSGDTETALTILRNIVAHQRNAAQAVQATRILKQLNPETQLYNAEKTVASLQEDLQKKYGDKAPDLQIDEDLAERFLRAKDDETRDKAMQDIYRDIGRQMPTTFMDRWNAWRYLAMLGNPRTHVRNVVGNLGFAPVVGAKDLTASAIEGIVNVISGGKLERTKGNVIGRGDLLKAAWNDYANIQDEALGESKYSERQMANKEIQEGRKIFGNTKSKAWNRTGGKVLETVRRVNGTALDAEDVLFSKPHYALALAQYCAANGISAEQIAKGEGLAKAREYAIKEAQKATYRDTNEFSQAISQLGRGSQWQTNKFTRGVSTVMEGVLPFRKTPANILARGVEYSPLGLMKSLTYDAVQVKKGNMSASEMIDDVSAGLTGTGLLALGVYLASQGILGVKLRGRGGGDDKKKKYADLTGHQDYALELPDGTSITLDWLAPEALPVFIGANLAEIAQEKNGSMKLADILTAVGNVTEPMLEMSCLQSLNNVFEAVGYAKEGDMNALTSALASAATSYLTQALPTLLGQAERTGEGKRMTTYTDKNSFLTGDMQYTLGKISAKIPGFEYNQIPYIDAWGREELTGKFLERAGNNFFNPAFTSKVVESDMEKEIERLYDVTGENVFPQRAAKYFNVDGERKDLTADEYVKYATAKGQTSYVLAYRMTENSLYKDLSDTDKAACIKDVYTYANQTAETEVGGEITKSWVTEAKKGVAIGISPETYILAMEAVKDVKGIKDSKGETIDNSPGLQKMEIIYSMPGLNDEQRQYLFGCFDVGQKVIGYNKALVSEKLDGLRSGKITSVTAGTKTETKAKTETKKEETPKVEEKPKKETADVSGSTAISSAVYDPETETATVKWASNGRTYTYDVTPESWEGFKNSSSKGSYVNKNWK